MKRGFHRYSENEIDYLKLITPGRTNKEITKLFNEKFSLNQGEKAIAETRKRNKIKTGADGRFKKGGESWNKGKKGFMGPNITSFKKGDMPHNWVPIGSKRITKDGYIQIKTQEGKFQQNWRGEHILIWEKENGTLPESHAIIFGDGNMRNFDINNLILVSRKQLLGLNKEDLIQNDVELTKVAINIVDLTYKISEKCKEV